MRTAVVRAAVVRAAGRVLVLAGAALLCACDLPSDTVEREYATLAEARQDGLFDRGWLPDILPLSARDIRTNNNLDHNTSTGEFSFDPKDAPGFIAPLKPGAVPAMKFADWNDIVAAQAADGRRAWSYREGAEHGWVFFCDLRKGYCEYMLS